MGAAKKYPGNGCGVRDGLSGDMLASSQCNPVLSFFNLIVLSPFTAILQLVSYTFIMFNLHITAFNLLLTYLVLKFCLCIQF